jgi:hypothetical protein
MNEIYFSAVREVILDEGHHDLRHVSQGGVKGLRVWGGKERKPYLECVFVEVGLEVEVDVEEVVVLGDFHAGEGVLSLPLSFW